MGDAVGTPQEPRSPVGETEGSLSPRVTQPPPPSPATPPTSSTTSLPPTPPVPSPATTTTPSTAQVSTDPSPDAPDRGRGRESSPSGRCGRLPSVGP